MANIVIAGDSSGSVTLQAPSVSGSTVLTLPTTSGTILTTAGGSTVPFAAGSAAAPSITFTGDTNTGIFSPAADTIAFSEGGVESMRIDSAGNVGIGTSSPVDKLHVAGGNGVVNHGQAWAARNSAGTANAAFFGSAGRVDFGIAGNFAVVDGESGILFGKASTNTEWMRLDSSGNLGLGVTPSAWNSSYKAFQFGSGSIATVTTGEATYLHNAFINSSGNYAYVNTAAAARYSQAGGVHYWFNAPSGTAGNAITWTQAMTLDASGNLGVGRTSIQSSSGGSSIEASGALFVGGPISAHQTSRGVFQYNNSETSIRSYGATANSGQIVFTTGGGGSADTERMRIDSSGRVFLMNSPVLIGGNGNYREYIYGAGGGTAYRVISNGDWAIGFYNATDGHVGNIQVNSTSTTYTTSSDYRLKENIAPMTGALDKVAQLKPCTYTWKADGSAGEGFIAHELAEVVPQCVTGEKDAVDADGNPVYQGIDTSFLVATLTAAIKEQQAIINDLTTRLTALENK